MYNNKNKHYKFCLECGKLSNGKPFCYYCYNKYYKLTPEEKLAIQQNLPYTNKIFINNTTEEIEKNNCIYCGKISYTKKFCEDCYNKYFNLKSQTDKAKNENETITYKLKNNITVKSKSELLIGKYLIEHHINFEYEKPFEYSYNKKPLKPDFYIKGPKFFKGRILKDIYIEHIGGAKSNNPQEQEKYRSIINYKMPIYKENKITLICTYEEDLKNIEESLTKKLKYCNIGMINYFKE